MAWDPDLAGSGLVLALATGTLALACWRALARGRVYAILYAGLAFYGFQTLRALPGLASQYSGATAHLTAWVFAIGTASLLVAVWYAARMLPGRPGRRFGDWSERLRSDGDAHVRWAAVATAASLALFVADRGSQVFELSWSEFRVESGRLTQAAAFLQMFAAPGAVTAFLRGKRAWGSALLLGALLCFLMQGQRAAILGGIAFVAWIMLARTESAMRRLRLLAALTAFALLAHTALRFLRGPGLFGLAQAVAEGNVGELFAESGVGEDLSGGESGIPSYFGLAVDIAGAPEYGFMTSVKRLLLFFIPRETPGIPKPGDVVYQLWIDGFIRGDIGKEEVALELLSQFVATESFGSVHPTLFGELFVSGRWLSLVLSCLFVGLFCVFVDWALDRLPASNGLLVLGPVLVGMLYAARGSSVLGLGYFLYLTVPVVVAHRLLTGFRRLKVEGAEMAVTREHTP